MADMDDVLTRYKIDIEQPKKEMALYQADLRATETIGVTTFDRIGDAAGETVKQVGAVGAEADKANQKLKGLGDTAGKSKTQFNALGNSVNQITRELPAFTMNLNTGFLAISNNLPMLADAIRQVKVQNAELAASGQKTQSVLKTVAAAVFSWQTALSIGITLLTAYGGKVIGFITGQEDSADATKSAEEALKKYNDQLKIQRILQNTLTSSVKNELALLDDENAAQKKVFDLRSLDAKQKKEVIDLNEREEQAIQDLFKTYEVSYTDYLKLREVENDPSKRAALGATELERLQSTVRISTQMHQQLLALEGAYTDERKSLTERQNKEYFDLVNTANNDLQQENINSLRRRIEREKAAGNDVFNLQVELFNKEAALLDEGTQKYLDKINERDVYILEETRKRGVDRKQLIDSANKYFIEQQEEVRRQIGAELDQMAKDYETAKARETKAAENALKERGELWKDEIRVNNLRKEMRLDDLQEEYDFSETGYARRSELLKEMLDENLITQREYVEATKQLNQEEMEAKLQAISSIGSALGSIAQILGQNTEEGKALAIAGTLIDTYAAAQKAYLAALVPPGPGANIRAIIAAAAATASGLARVVAISNVNVPKPQAKQVQYDNSQRFKDGVVDVYGPGTGTSDSIPALISRGESVITASSTAAKKDELKALNRSVIDYERLITLKYVMPAIEAEKQKQSAFAENVARSVMMNFNTDKVVKAIEKNRPATSDDIASLTRQLAKQDRLNKFESKLRRRK